MNVAQIVTVLDEHELVGKTVPVSGADHRCPMVSPEFCQCQQIVIGCTGCDDWVTEADGTQGDAHRAHVAEVIVALSRAELNAQRQWSGQRP